MAHRPALVALVLALIAGVAIAILTPPQKGGDERDHFTRAYQISTGSILTHRQGEAYGAYLPKSFLVDEARLTVSSYYDPDRTAFLSDLRRNAASGPKVFVSAGNAASYGPGAYLDYGVAIALGRALGLSTLALLYLARLAGVVTYALLLGLAVRRIPIRPWVLVGVGLLPTALNQASTVSADGLTLALSFVVVAEALRLRFDETAPRSRVLVESAAAATVLALAKPPYFVLVGLYALPAWRYRKELARPLAAVGAATVVVAAAWGIYQGSHSPSQDNLRLWLVVPPNQYAFHGIRTSAQTGYLLTHPLSFLLAVGRTFVFDGSAFPRQLFGMLALYQLPWALVLLAAACLCTACLVRDAEDRVDLDRTDRALLLGVSLVVVLAVFAIAYTNWNAYRAPRIDAVNTRYFLPVLPPLLLGLLPARARLPRLASWAGSPYLAIGLAAVVLVGSLVGMQRFHYSHRLRGPTATIAAPVGQPLSTADRSCGADVAFGLHPTLRRPVAGQDVTTMPRPAAPDGRSAAPGTGATTPASAAKGATWPVLVVT